MDGRDDTGSRSLPSSPTAWHGSDESGRVVNVTKVGSLPDGVVEAEGSLWVANTTDGEVTRINPETFAPIGKIEVGAGPTAIASGFGSIWVVNSDDRSVSRIHASTGDVVSKLTVGTAPYGIATDDRWVWVTNMLDGTLSRIDPEKDAKDAVDTFPVGQVPLGVTATAGAIWIADYEAGDVVRVDPITREVVDRIPVGNGPTSIASGRRPPLGRRHARRDRLAHRSSLWGGQAGDRPSVVSPVGSPSVVGPCGSRWRRRRAWSGSIPASEA